MLYLAELRVVFKSLPSAEATAMDHMVLEAKMDI